MKITGIKRQDTKFYAQFVTGVTDDTRAGHDHLRRLEWREIAKLDASKAFGVAAALNNIASADEDGDAYIVLLRVPQNYAPRVKRRAHVRATIRGAEKMVNFRGRTIAR